MENSDGASRSSGGDAVGNIFDTGHFCRCGRCGDCKGRLARRLEDVAPDKHEIACSRSFGQFVTALSDPREAISEFVSRAAEELRRQAVMHGMVLVFVRSSPFRSAATIDVRDCVYCGSGGKDHSAGHF